MVVVVVLGFVDVVVGGCVVAVVDKTVLLLGVETVPSTQYCWPTTSVGQLVPGFRASKFGTVMPQELARESHVSPVLATTL